MMNNLRVFRVLHKSSSCAASRFNVCLIDMLLHVLFLVQLYFEVHLKPRVPLSAIAPKNVVDGTFPGLVWKPPLVTQLSWVLVLQCRTVVGDKEYHLAPKQLVLLQAMTLQPSAVKIVLSE